MDKGRCRLAQTIFSQGQRGVERRKLHVRTGFYAKFMWQVLRFWPVVSSQMQPKSL